MKPLPRSLFLPACAAALVCAGLGACSSGDLRSPQERADALPMQADEFAKVGYRVDWRGFATLLPGSRSVTLDILGDAVGTLDSSGVFTVIDARGGAMRWSDQPAGPLTRFYGAIRDGNQIILSSETDTYIYDAATGTLNTKFLAPRVVSTRPAKVGGMLIYGTPSGAILAILRANGFVGWTSGVNGSIDFDAVRFGESPFLALASSTGEVLVLDGQSGSGRGRAKLFGGPGAPLGASDTVVFVASRDHSLYAVARETAQILWQHRTDAPLRHAPVFHDGRVYVDLGSQGLTALEGSTGKVLWSAKDVHGDVIALRRGKLFVVDGESARLVEPRNGAVFESTTLQGFSMFKATKFAEGDVYALSPIGVVTRLTPR